MTKPENKRFSIIVLLLTMIAVPALGYCLYIFFGTPSLSMPSADNLVPQQTIIVHDHAARTDGVNYIYAVEDESDVALLLHTLNNLRFTGPDDRPPEPGARGHTIKIRNSTGQIQKEIFVDYRSCVVEKHFIAESQAKVIEEIFSRLRLVK